MAPRSPVGTDPEKLALSDDGKYLYVALSGISLVQRVELPAGAVGLEIALGNDFYDGPRLAEDLAV